MDSINDLTIVDVGTKYFAPDTVPQQVSDAYNSNINALIDAYNTLVTQGSSISPTDAAAQYDAIYTARKNLIQIASNGVSLLPSQGVGYLNQRMATALNTLLKTLDLSGINVSPVNLTDVQMQTAVGSWLDLSVAGLANYLSDASVAGKSGRSIQAMISLEYIQAGNDLITRQLGQLETALNYTQSAVKILTTLQNIHNAASTGVIKYGATSRFIDPSSTSSSLILNSASGTTYVSSFQTRGASAFNQPLPVVAKPTGAQITQFNSYASPSGPLYSLISSLLPQYKITTNVAATFINGVVPSALNGSLPGTLYQVYYDMSNNAGGSITNWITDHMGAAPDYNLSLQGDYSVNLTTAQTAAESLNSQQSQNVQKTLFLFQEFYQSGSGMLTLLNQIIRSMAQQIGR